MATPKDIDSDLVLEIDGEAVTPEKFLRGVRAFFGVLNAVTKDVCRDTQTVQWKVQVGRGSNLVGVEPQAGFDSRVINGIYSYLNDGIKALEARAEEPENFPEPAIRYLKDLGGIAGDSEKTDVRVNVWVRRQPVGVTRKSVTHASDLLQEVSEDYGSIEGRLQMVSERGKMHFVVYEPVWDKPIRCNVGDDLAKKALDNFGKRVEVYGLVKYRADGMPASIKVDEIINFPERIPDFRKVYGSLRNYS